MKEKIQKFKEKDKIQKSNAIKIVIMKCLLVLGGCAQACGFIIGPIMLIGYKKEILGSWIIGLGFFLIPIVLMTIFYIISCTLKDEGGEGNPKDYKIKYYDCALSEDISIRMEAVYGQVRYSEVNPNNYYSAYHKTNEVVIVAVMQVDSKFNEDEFTAFMNEIPEITEKVISHTLVVIFLEKERSAYLKEIIYAPEYNSLWDTKIFSVYDREKGRLKVNKTNSGTGDKAYNDGRRELNKIFSFMKK